MHIALNAWFWNRPDTGSGQYLRNLTHALHRDFPDIQLTLVAPGSWEMDAVPDGVTVQTVILRRTGSFGKAGFEQQIFPDVAASIGAEVAHVPYWAAPLRSPIPVVVTVHDIIPLILPEYRGGVLARLYTGMVAASARGAAAVITDSEASKRDIVERLRIPAQQVTAIPLAAGPQYNTGHRGIVDMGVLRKYDLPEIYVLYLGGYDVRKNVRTLLQAYTYVSQGVGESVPLVLAGKLPGRITPRFDDIPFWIDKMRLDPYVRTIGWVDEADKPTLYREARVFAYPSTYEGFGLPVLEAMACGTPVVAGNTSSIPEIVGGAGFLVDPHDARRMAGSILANINQQNTYEKNREAGLQRAEAFSWGRTAAETVAVYRRVTRSLG